MRGFFLLVLPILASQVAAQIAPTQPLNDTGQTRCFEVSDGVGRLAECTSANTGDESTHPRQDGRYGRDAQAGAGVLVKSGAGVAGFDFTKIANDGSELQASATLGIGAADWACTRDNVTGLIWEVKATDNGLRHNNWSYSWGGRAGGSTCGETLSQCNTDDFVVAVNAVELCGFNDWRLPRRREWLSIVHHGAINPAIDTTFFPNALADFHWSGDTVVSNQTNAWGVLFIDGETNVNSKTAGLKLRLVRSGP